MSSDCALGRYRALPAVAGFPRGALRGEGDARCEVQKDRREAQDGDRHPVTDLPPEQASSERLLELNRGYWGAVGNGVHHVRDGALPRDASRLRKGALPQVMAAFANLALSILRMLGF